MRSLLKHFILDTITLYLISETIGGMEFNGGPYTILLTGLVLMLATMIIKPVLNILLLPFNLVTFGLFKWVAFAITFYLVTLVVPGFILKDFTFTGFNNYWFVIPALHLSGFLAFLAFSFLISTVSSILRWIFK